MTTIKLIMLFLAVYTAVFVTLIGLRAEEHTAPKRDYELSLSMDSVYIYDNERFVGAVPWSEGLIDSTLYSDNQ